MLGIIMKYRIFDLAGIYGWGGFKGTMRSLLSSNDSAKAASTIESKINRATIAMNKDLDLLRSFK